MAGISSLVKTVAKKALGRVALPVAAVSGAIDIAKVGKATSDISKARTAELEATNKMVESTNALAKKRSEEKARQKQSQASTPAPSSTPSSTSSGNGNSSVASRGLVSSSNDSLTKAINDAGDSSEDAAKDAEKAQTKAAEHRYNEQVMAATDAKGSAAGQYQWIIDTLGSNKKDLLSKIALSEEEGIKNFETQESSTTGKYDSARQEILNTYRDLNRNQEKILRGSGTAQSSRSQEATLRLNGLLGKDLSGISKNEADSLALIGSAPCS